MENIFYAVLGLLVQNDKHGYELFKDISNPTGIGQIYAIKIGRLYGILKILEGEKFVSSRIDSEGNRPPKKVYCITSDGFQVFQKWMSDPIKHGREIRIGFLLKLFFLNGEDANHQKKIIDDQISECQTWQIFQEDRLGGKIDSINIEYFVRQFRKSQIKGYITWLVWCKRRLLND